MVDRSMTGFGCTEIQQLIRKIIFKVSELHRWYEYTSSRILCTLIRYISPMHRKNSEPPLGLLYFTERSFSKNSIDLVMVPIGSIWSLAHFIQIP
jgi:hypothetical protein